METTATHSPAVQASKNRGGYREFQEMFAAESKKILLARRKKNLDSEGMRGRMLNARKKVLELEVIKDFFAMVKESEKWIKLPETGEIRKCGMDKRLEAAGMEYTQFRRMLKKAGFLPGNFNPEAIFCWKNISDVSRNKTYIKDLPEGGAEEPPMQIDRRRKAREGNAQWQGGEEILLPGDGQTECAGGHIQRQGREKIPQPDLGAEPKPENGAENAKELKKRKNNGWKVINARELERGFERNFRLPDKEWELLKKAVICECLVFKIRDFAEFEKEAADFWESLPWQSRMLGLACNASANRRYGILNFMKFFPYLAGMKQVEGLTWKMVSSSEFRVREKQLAESEKFLIGQIVAELKRRASTREENSKYAETMRRANEIIARYGRNGVEMQNAKPPETSSL